MSNSLANKPADNSADNSVIETLKVPIKEVLVQKLISSKNNKPYFLVILDCGYSIKLKLFLKNSDYNVLKLLQHLSEKTASSP